MIQRLPLLLILLLLMPLGASAQQRNQLPDMGESGVLPVGQERMMGRVWLMSFRRSAPIVEDPLMQVYLENLINELAQESELQDRRIVLVAVDNSTINAFAVPGGVVGVHTGLISKAETEAELASVLTHELAHISQRHFSRGVEAQKVGNMAMLGGLLAGMVAIAAGSADAGIGAIAGGQAAAQQRSLSFSRAHEQEADRIGIQNLYRAGQDPMGASNMFKVMQRESRRYGSRPPEFLLTHPLTESRISDARNRASQFPRRMYPDNPSFQLMRVRSDLGFIRNDDEAVARYRSKLKRKGRNAESHQYGLALALTRKREFAEALELLKPLREYSPENLAYILAEADIYIESGEFDDAAAVLRPSWAVHPDSHPIIMMMVKAHLRAGRYTEAETILAPHARRRGSDPYPWYVLAEVQGLSGNTYELHQSRAQYFFLTGDMLAARAQLGHALRLAPDEVARERIRTEQRQVEGAARALGQLK